MARNLQDKSNVDEGPEKIGGSCKEGRSVGVGRRVGLGDVGKYQPIYHVTTSY